MQTGLSQAILSAVITNQRGDTRAGAVSTHADSFPIDSDRFRILHKKLVYRRHIFIGGRILIFREQMIIRKIDPAFYLRRINAG